MAIDLRLGYDRATKERAAAMFAEGLRPAAVAAATGAPADTVREWELTYRACERDVLLNMGKKCPTYDYETRLAVAREVVDGGLDAGRGDGQARRGEPPHGQAVVPPVPRGRRGGAPSQVRGQAARTGREGGPEDPRAGARGPRPEARGAGRIPKKIDSPEGGEALPNREKALAVTELSGQGHALADLLEAAGLARSSYYYALAHPKAPARPKLRPRVAVNLPRFRLHPYAAFRAAPSRCLAPDSAGLRFPSAEWIPTLLQKASMHSKIPSDARSRVSKVPACTH